MTLRETVARALDAQAWRDAEARPDKEVWQAAKRQSLAAADTAIAAIQAHLDAAGYAVVPKAGTGAGLMAAIRQGQDASFGAIWQTAVHAEAVKLESL